MHLQHVNYIYGMGTSQECPALCDINLEIRDGEFIGLVGHSGSGKSTLIQLLNGLERVSSGEIYFNGQDIYDPDYSLKELRGKVGLVFQYPEHQLFETSVIADVEFGPKNLGLDQLDVELRSFQALKQVGIGDDLLDVSPLALSGGQKRRVAIAGVLAMEPEILILDEPMAGLDPAGRDEILELLAGIHREKQITIILVSHSMDDVAKYADRILVMNAGQIVLDGTPRQVFQYEDELRQIGLDVPQSTALLHRLSKETEGLRTDGITVQESVDAILDWIQE
ncbi:MAG: energy-coupling factor transporter ATPase [Eubacteriales bacterium]|nr:energy-coupling factor transporter ATPase [Eubacteriales bacterium]